MLYPEVLIYLILEQGNTPAKKTFAEKYEEFFRCTTFPKSFD